MVSSNLPRPVPLSHFAYAHRGLWTKGGAAENSLPAFHAAADAGLGVELDVRPSADNIPIVFHDADLKRMTGQDGVLANMTRADITKVTLPDGSAVPTLAEVLEIFPDNLPILCELKIDGDAESRAFLDAVAQQLLKRHGLTAAMSFDAETVKAMPKTLQRGQLIAPKTELGVDAFHQLIADSDSDHCDYLACYQKEVDVPALQAARAHKPLIVWTVKDAPRARDIASLHDGLIFEGFSADIATSLIGPAA